MSAPPPPADVLAAFGARGPARSLPGGQGGSWAAGGVVLKRAADSAVQEWLGRHFDQIEQRGFRLAAPVPSAQGQWAVDGWSATELVAGAEPDHRRAPRWAEIIAAGRALHRALADFARPEFVAAADSWWAVADRMAWGEQRARLRPELDAVAARLRPALAPLGAPRLAHCDLTGNVLFADGAAPAIIDLSLYWRPGAYADGVVVADALCWHNAPGSLADDLQVPVAAVARALLFRIGATQQRAEAGANRSPLPVEADRYHRAASALGL